MSIVIVNYNVKVFLEQCLLSVREAAKKVDAEVFVVDNASVDGSVEILKEKFPDITLIANTENVGFSKANNQAIRLAKGRYVLLLNPDTLVEEDTFRLVVDFMDKHPEAGGLGVKMVDGKGKFLPESKRGLPTPMVALYKISGLSKLFPKSKIFSKYHLGYLDKDEIHEVEILSGAFMLMRKEALDKVGLLDESFFMYGEDIDLSYRILQGGYKNYYFPKTRIIHYKGESTKKSSVNYVFVFYKAMVIFAKKHFSDKNARFFSFLINLAIYLRAALAIVRRFVEKILHPLIDALILAGGLLLIKNYWEKSYLLAHGSYYPDALLSVAFPVYISIWLLSVFFSGGYDRPIQLLKLFQGVFIGTFVILVGYALLPEYLRFSRAIIIFGTVWALVALSLERILFHYLGFKRYRIGEKRNRRYAVVGDEKEVERVSSLLKNLRVQPTFIGHIALSALRKYKSAIGSLDALGDLLRIYAIDEVIFCSEDVTANIIIDNMSKLSGMDVEIKIAPPKSWAIVGSQSINTLEDIYVVDIDSINKVSNRRNKRALDIVLSLLLLLSFPVNMFWVKKKRQYFKNLCQIAFGKKSFVGYSPKVSNPKSKLPQIKQGVLSPADSFDEALDEDTLYNLNMLYAKDYSVKNDLRIISKAFANLGNG